MKENKSFWEYINASTKDPSATDAYQIVMMAQMLGQNISLLYGNGEKWSTDPSMQDDIILVYKGDREFLPTDVGTYQICFFLYAKEIDICVITINSFNCTK